MLMMMNDYNCGEEKKIEKKKIKCKITMLMPIHCDVIYTILELNFHTICLFVHLFAILLLLFFSFSVAFNFLFHFCCCCHYYFSVWHFNPTVAMDTTVACFCQSPLPNNSAHTKLEFIHVLIVHLRREINTERDGRERWKTKLCNCF